MGPQPTHFFGQYNAHYWFVRPDDVNVENEVPVI